MTLGPGGLTLTFGPGGLRLMFGPGCGGGDGLGDEGVGEGLRGPRNIDGIQRQTPTMIPRLTKTTTIVAMTIFGLVMVSA